MAGEPMPYRGKLTLQIAASWSLLSCWLPLFWPADGGALGLRIAGLAALACAPSLWIASFRPPHNWAAVLLTALARPLAAATVLLGMDSLAWPVQTWLVAELLLLPLLGAALLGWLRSHVLTLEAERPRLESVLPSELRSGRWLVALVRHRGCTFCRETLAELGQREPDIAAQGFQLAVVHMGDEASGAVIAARYGLRETHMVADPKRELYRALDLPRGGMRQMFGPRIWWRGFVAGVLRGHWVGGLEGDGFQLGGAVRLTDGHAEVLHRARDAADIGNWSQIVAALPDASIAAQHERQVSGRTPAESA
ncbi:MAG: AhpC/TSA family protein [Planctomycetota bacterium]